MVGQCDPPFRALAARHGSNLVYTEMFLAGEFSTSPQYRSDALGPSVDASLDPRLLVQFASRVPEEFAAAAVHARTLGAWGADLNLGCPQVRARDHGYGSYLQEEKSLVYSMVRAASKAAGSDGLFAITVKIRLQSTVQETVEYATRLKEAGAVMIMVHGRQRGSVNARRDGSADLESVKAVVEALAPFPVLSNGNVRTAEDVVENLKYTGAAGVGVAEEVLRRPFIFDEVTSLLRGSAGTKVEVEVTEKRGRLMMLAAYLDVCEEMEEDVPREDGSEWVKSGGEFLF